MKLAEVAAVDPKAKTASTTTGEVYQGDYLVLAAGSQANFFKTPAPTGTRFPCTASTTPCVCAASCRSLKTHAGTPSSSTSALNFVVVGAGATGVETAGALAELINETMVAEYPDLAVSSARIHLVDHGHTVLAPFSDRAHDYAEKVLRQAGVQLLLKTGVKEVGAGHVLLSDDTTIKTRVVVWAGGLMAARRSPAAPACLRATAAGSTSSRTSRSRGSPPSTFSATARIRQTRRAALSPSSGPWQSKPELGRPGTSLARHYRPATHGLSVPRPGHHGDDHPPCGRRRDRRESARTGRLAGRRRVAWRSRQLAERNAQQGRRLCEVDLGAFLGRPRSTVAQSDRRQAHRLGGRHGGRRAAADASDRGRRKGSDGRPSNQRGKGRSGNTSGVGRRGESQHGSNRKTHLPGAVPHMAPVTHSAANLPEALSREYDVIIVGTGAGGGTLVRDLAASGKRILLLERGDFLPREKENWDAKAVFVENRYVSPDTWYDAGGKPFQPGVHYYVGGATKMYGAALFRLRKEDFKEFSPSRWHVPRVAHLVRRPRTLLHQGGKALLRTRAARSRPHRAPCQ